MSRNPRQSIRSNSRSSHNRRRYAQVSFVILLLLTIACGVFVYQVSPLRDPSFQPNSANAGSLVPWLRGVRESDWIRGAAGLAGLLATNIAVLLWQLSETSRTVLIDRQQPPGMQTVKWGVLLISYLGIGLVIFAGLWLLFMGYLLAQWLVD